MFRRILFIIKNKLNLRTYEKSGMDFYYDDIIILLIFYYFENLKKASYFEIILFIIQQHTYRWII